MASPDEAWLRRAYRGLARLDDADIEDFCERVAIKTESGIAETDARRQALDCLIKRLLRDEQCPHPH